MTTEADPSRTEGLAYRPIRTLIEAVALAGDLSDIYDASLSALRDGIGVAKSSILLFDDDGVMRFKAWLNLSPAYREAVEGHSPWTPETQDPQPVLVEDVQLDESLASLAPAILDEGIRALAFIPLAAGRRLLGKFMLYYGEPHAFKEGELQFARIAASQVAFAIDQHRALRSVEESGEQYRQLVEGIAQAVYTTDAEGRIQLFNEAAVELWGRRPEVNKDLWCGSWRIFRPDGSPMPLDQCPMAMTIKQNRPVRGEEIWVERPDGRRVWVAPYPTPLCDRAGRLVGAVNVLVDITERKAAEEELRAAAALKDQFLGLVSHELRTPISTVVANALILRRRGDELDAQDRDQALEDIATEGAKLQRVIEDLLLLTRLDVAGEPTSEPLLLRALIEAQAEVFRRRRTGRTLNLDIEATAARVPGQQALLSMVLDNLLSNADKYSSPETPITVTLRSLPDAKLELRVRDEGIGVEASELSKLFTPFYRTAPARGYASGMGLGLAVCKRILDTYGGSIHAESRLVGGTDFVVVLPVWSEAGC